MWKKGQFEGYGQRLFDLEIQEGIFKGTKLETPKDKVDEK